MTTAEGHYYLAIRKNAQAEPISVMTEVPGYRKGLLEDQEPPFRERSYEDRAAVIAETVDSDLASIPIRYPDNAQLVSRDLVLVPEKKNIK